MDWKRVKVKVQELTLAYFRGSRMGGEAQMLGGAK